MKLVFYSGGFPEENENLDKELIKLFQKEKLSLTFIPSSSEGASEEYHELIEQYSPLGIQSILKLNIDQPFSDTMKKIAFKSDIIHLGGGNTFYFLKQLRKNNLIAELKEFVNRGGVLTGLSAGAIIMTNNVSTAGFPSFDRDENDENIKNLKGMDLVPFEFFPHYRNSKRYDKELLDYSNITSKPIYACPDGSGIFYFKNEIRFLGKTVCFHKGQKHHVMK